MGSSSTFPSSSCSYVHCSRSLCVLSRVVACCRVLSCLGTPNGDVSPSTHLSSVCQCLHCVSECFQLTALPSSHAIPPALCSFQCSGSAEGNWLRRPVYSTPCIARLFCDASPQNASCVFIVEGGAPEKK